MLVVEIEIRDEGDLVRPGGAGGRGVVEPVVGLNVVLRTGGVCAARAAGSEGGAAQTLEEIVRGAVFLKDDNDVFEMRDLGVGGYRSTESQEKQTYGGQFHSILRELWLLGHEWGGELANRGPNAGNKGL